MNEYELKDIATILNGYSFKSSNYIAKGIRIIRITNVQKGKIIDESPVFYEESKNLEKFKLQDKDIVISLTGNVGRVGFVEKKLLPAYLNQRVGCIRCNETLVNSKYLYYLLDSSKFENDCISSSNGIAQLNLSTEWLKKYKISIPSIDEQKKRISILEKIDNMIRINERQIEKFDKLVQSQFNSMFGDLNKNDKNLKICQLIDVCNKITDGTHDTPKRISEGVMLVTGKNIKENQIDLTNVEYVSMEDHKKIYKRCNPEKGDVLYTNIGVNFCVATVNDLDFEFSMKNIALLKPNKEYLDSIYLSYALNYLRNKIVFLNKSSGAQTFIGLASIKKIIIPVPNLLDQQNFAKFVNMIDIQKNLIIKQLNKLQELKESLMINYFA